MYNFLDSKLSPKVATTADVTENYEPTNLISGDLMTRARGFLVFTTVKPPVELTFELICPINVHYIALWTTVGSHRCTALEVAASSCGKVFTPVAYAKFDSGGVVFCNGRIYSASNLPENIDRSFHLGFFKSSSFRSFTAAKMLKVRILQTGGRVPCLGRAEVWGKASKGCSDVTVNTINRLMQERGNSSGQTVSNASASSCKVEIDELEIPDDFKDTITFEVMATPMTLPSGNTVDQSTMEKYIANEASYGRAASDPFTGQRFTETRKPVFNAALKSRIDMFLMQHSSRSETFAIKRTLGRKVDVKHKLDYSDSTISSKRFKEDENSSHITINHKYKDEDEKLNEAIEKIVNSKSFVKFTNEEKTSVCSSDVNVCSKCSSCDSNLYVLPCEHIYCRNCLLELCKKCECEKCGKAFRKNEPKRFHL